MSYLRTQHDDACGDRTQDLSIQSPMLYHYATALPINIINKPVNHLPCTFTSLVFSMSGGFP